MLDDLRVLADKEGPGPSGPPGRATGPEIAMFAAQELKTLLAEVKTIAVVGASDRPGRPVDRVGRYLLDAGFDVVPVHPARRSVWGLPASRSLADVDRPIHCVDLFRAAEHCAGHAREVLALADPPLVFWMQSGIVSPEAEAILAPTGVRVVQDRCLMVEHRRLAQ